MDTADIPVHCGEVAEVDVLLDVLQTGTNLRERELWFIGVPRSGCPHDLANPVVDHITLALAQVQHGADFTSELRDLLLQSLMLCSGVLVLVRIQVD